VRARRFIVVRFAYDIGLIQDESDADHFFRSELTERNDKFNLNCIPKRRGLLEFGP